MGQSVSGNAGGVPQDEGVVQSLGKAKLVVEHVEVITRRVPVEIPHVTIIEEETTRYTPRLEETIKYTPIEQPTTKFTVVDEETTRYVIRDEETVRYVPKDTPCERPVVTDKIYERPVVVEKEYQLVTFKDLEAIKEAMALLPKLIADIQELKRTRIVEEVIKVPRIEYVPTTVYRVTKSGELITNAD